MNRFDFKASRNKDIRVMIIILITLDMSKKITNGAFQIGKIKSSTLWSVPKEVCNQINVFPMKTSSPFNDTC